MLNSTNIFWAFQTAVLAWSALSLMEDGQLLEPYRRMLERKQFEMNSAWITKPLGLCGHCFCGQVGFWTAVFLFGISFKVILFTAFTLFFNELKNMIWNRVQTR